MKRGEKMKTDTAFLPLVLSEETAVLIRWQIHCHSLAVELTESLNKTDDQRPKSGL